MEPITDHMLDHWAAVIAPDGDWFEDGEAPIVIARLLDEVRRLKRENACPCCKNGVNLAGEVCDECKGKGLAIIAYEVLRVHYKLLRESLIGPKEKALAAKLMQLMRLAADEFGNHGCNDMDLELVKDWTDAEKIDFASRYHEHNGDPGEFGGTVKEFDRIPDYAFFGFLAAELKKEAERTK